MAVIGGFKDLVVWQKAMRLTREVYAVTGRFPREEMFGLTSQLRRASVSVCSNIAEGHARKGAEFSHFLSMSRGSLAELETQLLLAVDLNYLAANELELAAQLIDEVGRMLTVLGRRVRRPSIPYTLPPTP